MEQKHANALFSGKASFMQHAEKGRRHLSGPAAFAYEKALAHRHIRLELNFSNPLFFERLYTTIALWGMHDTKREQPKLEKFENFEASLKGNSEYFFRLRATRLPDFAAPSKHVSANSNALLSGLRLLKAGDSLTAATKTLHFILPELALPIDRGYTLWLFNEKYPATPQGERDLFFELMGRFAYESARLGLYKDFKPAPLQPSVPKLIDNAIIGYKIEYFKKSQK